MCIRDSGSRGTYVVEQRQHLRRVEALVRQREIELVECGEGLGPRDYRAVGDAIQVPPSSSASLSEKGITVPV